MHRPRHWEDSYEYLKGLKKAGSDPEPCMVQNGGEKVLVELLGCEERADHTYFEIRVTTPEATWTVYRRFSEFETHVHLPLSQVGLTGLPEFPPKRGVSGRMFDWLGLSCLRRQKHLTMPWHRAAQLRDYLHKLLLREDVARSAIMLNFLNARLPKEVIRRYPVSQKDSETIELRAHG
eukprot:Rmarinus@m.6694